MAIDIPTTEPARIRAGDTVTWRKSLADYPATDGWTLYYRLINSAGKFDITCTADGADHLVEVSKTTSATYTAGDYSLIAWVANATERITLDPMRITVLPNVAAEATGYETRSQAKQMLDAIDAALLSLSSGERLAVVQAEVAARSLRYDFTGLMKLRNIYAAAVQAEINAERASLGLGGRNKLQVRL